MVGHFEEMKEQGQSGNDPAGKTESATLASSTGVKSETK